jgi:hypothetical protein
VALAAPPLARLALLFLKAAREARGVAGAFEKARAVIREQLARHRGGESLVVLWSYTLLVGEMPADALVAEIARVVGPEVAEHMKTLDEMLRERGLAQGREEGREEGTRSVLERQLVAKFGALPAAARARLAAARRAELERWAERLITAATLEDVLGPS